MPSRGLPRPGAHAGANDAIGAGTGQPRATELDAHMAAPLLLLVDDDQHSREGWAEFFLDAGYRVAQASDGPEALLKLEARSPDLMLVDLGMPRLDGWELTRRLKASPTWRQIPIVAFSGLDYPEALERITAAGCDAFVSKPCEPARLLAIVRGMLARERS